MESIITAARVGNMDKAKCLLSTFGQPCVNFRTSDGQTALLYAASHGDLRMATLLVDHGADVNAANDFGYTPLLRACESGHEDIAGMLLEGRASVRAAVKATRTTTLMFAAQLKESAVARRLLEELARGADATDQDVAEFVNARDANGCTALMFAAKTGQADTVHLLLQHGADVSLRASNPGWTAACFAAAYGHGGILRVLLGEGGALVNGQGSC